MIAAHCRCVKKETDRKMKWEEFSFVISTSHRPVNGGSFYPNQGSFDQIRRGRQSAEPRSAATGLRRPAAHELVHHADLGAAAASFVYIDHDLGARSCTAVK
jgi:hypothetical protein